MGAYNLESVAPCIQVNVTLDCSLIRYFRTRLTSTTHSQIPIVLSLIAHKLLRTSMHTTDAAFPHLKPATVLALMPLARMPKLPASTKSRAQLGQRPTSTSTISALLCRIRFPPRPTFLTLITLPYSLGSALCANTWTATKRRIKSLQALAMVSQPH